MPLNPIDVQQKTFGTALRGYDLDEVDDFLDEVVTTLVDYEQRLRDAQDRIHALESQLAERGSAETAIARALVAAQRSADTIVAEARDEADKVLAAAHAEANEYAAARALESQKQRSEIESLRAVMVELRSRLGGLAASALDRVGEMEGSIDEAERRLSAPAPEVVEEAAPAAWAESEPQWAEPEPWAEAVGAEVDTGGEDVTVEVPTVDEPVLTFERTGDEALQRVTRPWERG